MVLKATLGPWLVHFFFCSVIKIWKHIAQDLFSCELAAPMEKAVYRRISWNGCDSLLVPLPGNGWNPITALTDVTVGHPVTAQVFCFLFAISSPVPFMTPDKHCFERGENLHIHRWGWWRSDCSTLRLTLVQVLEDQYSLGIKGQAHFPVGVWSLFTLKLQISLSLLMGKAGAPTSLFMLEVQATSALWYGVRTASAWSKLAG